MRYESSEMSSSVKWATAAGPESAGDNDSASCPGLCSTDEQSSHTAAWHELWTEIATSLQRSSQKNITNEGLYYDWTILK